VLDRWGVRGRIVGVAVLILVVTVAGWTWLVVTVFDSTLAHTARSHAELQARQIAVQLETMPPSDAVPQLGPGYGDAMLQVVSGDQVLAASEHDALASPIGDLHPAPGQLESTEVSGIPGIDNDRFVIVAAGATGPDGVPLVAMVASPIHIEEGAVSRTVLAGALAAALVLTVSTLLVRWAVGAALQPVELLRGQLAAIDGRTIGDRVDVPVTGDELTRLGDTMNQMLARLEGAYAIQKTFVSDASHELRSPLATVRASVELAAADPSGRVWAETQPTVSAEILRLQGLVDDLLTLSRYDAGALPLRMRECDLDDLVVAAARRTREETTAQVEVRVDPVRTVADPDRVGQVLRNLLDNAARHSERRLRVSLTQDGPSAVVLVDNDGPPVPEDQRQRIFERFVRLDDTRGRDSGGSGLGLAIAADLVRAHDGTLVATVADDGWCRFELRLPRSDPEE
jgi:signal transduction histidine kinase